MQSLISYLIKIFILCNALLEFRAQSLDNLRLRIENSRFEPCPHVKNGRLVNNNSHVDVSQQQSLQKFGVARLSHLRLIDDRGGAKDLILPGCFNVRVDATFTQNVRNPYVEAFVKSDRDEPCRKFKPNPYCPPTDNLSAKVLTQNQVTCKFCDLCESVVEAAAQANKGKQDVTVRVNGNACSNAGSGIKAGQVYPFEVANICTPSTEEMEKQLDQKFGPSWHDVDFIRRGSVVLTLHIMDRRNAPPKACLELGAGSYKWKGPSVLESRVVKNLEDTCKRYQNPVQESDKPKDDYLGCYNGYINYAIDRL